MFDVRARARLKRSRPAAIGGAVVGLLVLFAVVGPAAAHHGPLESDFEQGISSVGMPVGPNALFLFGADRLFRDVFVRLAYAGRLSLFVALAATLIATGIGAVVGIAAGWTEGTRTRVPWPLWVAAAFAAASLSLGRPGWAAVAIAIAIGAIVSGFGRFAPGGLPIDMDMLLMRLVDVMLAFPFLLLVMAIGAALDRASALTILLTLGLTSWLGIARVLRAKTMQVRSRDFVVAARALGLPTVRILLRHVLPNVAGTLVISATVLVAQMIVADSVLSYLGVGISPPTPTWGRMLLEGQDYLAVAPWLVIAPGAAILLAVLGFNLLGEGLRDALDPHEV